VPALVRSRSVSARRATVSRARWSSHTASSARLLGHDVLLRYSVKPIPTRGAQPPSPGWARASNIVSGGELARVLAAGGSAAKDVFSVWASEPQMRRALDAGVLCFNVESKESWPGSPPVARAWAKSRPCPCASTRCRSGTPLPRYRLREAKFGIAYGAALPLNPSGEAAGTSSRPDRCHTSLAPSRRLSRRRSAEKVLEFVDVLEATG